jgi:hypothetical protein
VIGHHPPAARIDHAQGDHVFIEEGAAHHVVRGGADVVQGELVGPAHLELDRVGFVMMIAERDHDLGERVPVGGRDGRVPADVGRRLVVGQGGRRRKRAVQGQRQPARTRATCRGALGGAAAGWTAERSI